MRRELRVGSTEAEYSEMGEFSIDVRCRRCRWSRRIWLQGEIFGAAMEWLTSDWRKLVKWGKQPQGFEATMEWLKSDWRKVVNWGNGTPGFLARFRPLVAAEDDEEYAILVVFNFCTWLAYGIIVGVGLIIYWVHRASVRSRERLQKARYLAAMSNMNLDDVRKFFPEEYFPYWIVMGKYEKVNWINHFISKVWPFYSKSQSEIMKETWEPWIDPYRPLSISQLSFQKFTLGSVPPVFLGVRMVPASSDEIALEAECQWQGNPSIIMRVRTSLGLTFSIQIKDVTMLVVLRIIFRPLVNELPGFGAFTYSVSKKKKFDFTLKLIGGDISTIPGLGNSVEEMIKTSFLDTLMWPMRIPVPVIPSPVDRDYSRLQRHFNPRRGAIMYSAFDSLKAQPVGILDVKLVQAKDLKLKDTVGKVGPFALLFIRQMPRLMKRSKTIENAVTPIWNEIYEFEVEDPATQKLVVKILDEEADQETELLGCCQVFLKDLEPGVLTEKWIRLMKNLEKEDVKYRGEVNLELLYRPYDKTFQPIWIGEGTHEDTASTSAGPGSTSGSPQASMLFNEDLNARQGDRTHALDPAHSYKGQLWETVRGVLSVTVERAANLVSKDINGLSDPYVVLRMRKSRLTKETKVIYRSLNPEWNETIDFMVEDGFHDMLQIKVWDHDTFGKDFLGEYATTLTRVIHDGEYKAEFKLKGVSSGLIFLTMKWIPQPFKKMGQRRLGIF